MEGVLAPWAVEGRDARRFALAAAAARAAAWGEPSAWIRRVEQRLDDGSLFGRLYFVGGHPRGFVSWSDEGPLGLVVDLLYVAPGSMSADHYRRILVALRESVGPAAFVPGALPGLEHDVEDHLMRALGFRRFGRSEMARPPGAVVPEARSPPTGAIRPANPSDLASLGELHYRAYHDRFDRYLFLELEDEQSDALREVRQVWEGRWGAFYPEGSWLEERAGRPVGCVLTVHGPDGALIADVMVDPALQGQGIGRRVLAAALQALQHAGEGKVYLNVTEGNERAIRLYRSVGFVRSLGPSWDWYDASRIPVAPSHEA